MTRCWASVESVAERRDGVSQLLCRLDDGALAKAVAFTAISGCVSVGDRVLLNTTAVDLKLGSGGSHFVIAALRDEESSISQAGHIVKLRYTPAQVAVNAVEEPGSPFHDELGEADSLLGMPVVCCELISQVPAVVAGLVHGGAAPRIAVVVTDDAALGIAQCDLLAELRARGHVASVITTGQAFGGDIEAVNSFSGLLAARYVVGADVAVVSPGHGVVGTDTAWGFSGVRQGEALNAVYSLGGRPVAVVRASGADARPRHRGVSHHTRTVFARVALAPFAAAWPLESGSPYRNDWESLIGETGSRIHGFEIAEAPLALDWFETQFRAWTTMGRTRLEDALFFDAAAAAGILARRLWEETKV